MISRSVVVRNVDNQWEIPELFWRTLQQRMSSENAGSAPLWQAFLQSDTAPLEMSCQPMNGGR